MDACHPKAPCEAYCLVPDDGDDSSASTSCECSCQHVETFVVGEYHLSSCPICLERFTLDNPAIMVPCEHGFHLQCLEAWRDRSPNCPVCLRPLEGVAGRVMDANDTKYRRRSRIPHATVLELVPGIAKPVDEKCSSPSRRRRQFPTTSAAAISSHHPDQVLDDEVILVEEEDSLHLEDAQPGMCLMHCCARILVWLCDV